MRRFWSIPIFEGLIIVVMFLTVCFGYQYGLRTLDTISMWIDPPGGHRDNLTLYHFWLMAGNGIDWKEKGDPANKDPMFPSE